MTSSPYTLRRPTDKPLAGLKKLDLQLKKKEKLEMK